MHAAWKYSLGVSIGPQRMRCLLLACRALHRAAAVTALLQPGSNSALLLIRSAQPEVATRTCAPAVNTPLAALDGSHRECGPVSSSVTLLLFAQQVSSDASAVAGLVCAIMAQCILAAYWVRCGGIVLLSLAAAAAAAAKVMFHWLPPDPSSLAAVLPDATADPLRGLARGCSSGQTSSSGHHPPPPRPPAWQLSHLGALLLLLRIHM